MKKYFWNSLITFYKYILRINKEKKEKNTIEVRETLYKYIWGANENNETVYAK